MASERPGAGTEGDDEDEDTGLAAAAALTETAAKVARRTNFNRHVCVPHERNFELSV